ncbi:hypothetical protein Tco_0702714 [Tanacetum coccineum]|uniref:Uncharacterized protein n=1 Tax=Tanacetum coccineum TaxID=301880 RepID=A0ABQ4XYP7_9ASTR
MPTEMELTLEQTQQGVSYEVSLLSNIEDSHGPSNAKLNPPQPLKVSQQTLVSFLTEITRISIDFLTPTGNPVKEILLKLNLPDHRIRKDGVKEFPRSFRHSDTERLSRSDEVLKLKNFKKDATLKLFKSTNQERYVPELRRNLISLGTLKKDGFTVKMQSGKIKVIKGSLVILSGTRRANCVYTLDGQAVTRKTLKGRKQLGEYQIGWKIKTGNILDFCNQRSTQQCTKRGVAKHLGVAGLQQQNGLVEETNVTPLAKWVIKLWRLDDVTSKVVLYRNMGFNESGEYKKTFIGSGVDTGSVQVLQGVEFEVYREDSNESAFTVAAFAVAAVKKIYAHELLTFNDTVA